MRDAGGRMRVRRTGRLLKRVLLSCGLLCGLCLPLPSGGSAAGSGSPSKILGSWGGFHIGLTLEKEGGSLEFDCAHGTIDEPFLVDAEGKFDLRGTYVQDHPGPIHNGETPDRHPARYSGSVQGDTMVLSGTVPDRNQSLGPFELFQGKTPRVHKCL